MAGITAQVQFGLAWYARWFLIGATLLAKYMAGVRVPHRLVVAVTNRSWRMRIGNGPWVPIRIDNTGRIIQ